MLFWLLLIPTIIIIIGLIAGKGRITWKEFLITEGIMILLIAGGWHIARQQSIHDVEIWNGWIAKASYYEEWWEQVPCQHSIPCSHLDKDGDPIHVNDGYYHLYDVDYVPPYWEAETSNNEKISIDEKYFQYLTKAFGNSEYIVINRSTKDHGRGNKYITRYLMGQSEFIPTAIEHSFINYIKASPNTIWRRSGQGDKFKVLIPNYPRVENKFECNRVLPMGLNIPDIREWAKELSAINGRLGSKKQVNIILVVVNTSDSSYLYNLEQKWLGGKKNDLVIIIGATNYPHIDWVRIMSWSKSEQLKVEIRDAISVLSLEKRTEILKTIESMVDQKFVRRPMADFKYLMASWQPTPWVTMLIFLLGVGITTALTIYFISNDPFNDDIN